MEEIYSYFLKKEKENGDILIKDFSSYFCYVKIKFFTRGERWHALQILFLYDF